MMTNAAVPAGAGSRIYAVRRPIAAFAAGAAVALLAGLIGLGGAEFRLPLLIMVFALYAHRAIRINLLISLATLAAAAVVRLRVIPDTQVLSLLPEIIAMSVGGAVAAWVGAGLLARIPRNRIMSVIAILLGMIAVLLVVETFLAGSAALVLPYDGQVRTAAALVAGIVIGSISSLLGVAGGEFIIPLLMLVYGADIRTAGTASVLISLPIVLTGVMRHFLAGKFRSRSMLGYLVLPMSMGSILGAVLGGYISVQVPGNGLRLALAAILVASAIKLWRKQEPAQGALAADRMHQ
jgi:uncharacterized membrane protein YfcA